MSRTAARVARILVLVGGAALVIAAKRQAPWIPWAYLVAVMAAITVTWRLLSWHDGPLRVRLPATATAIAVTVALLPVPWMDAATADPPGTAWRLDGRLEVAGEVMNPPGDWYWLTVGRPPLVVEVVGGWIVGSDAPTDLRHGNRASRPEVSEPAAAAVGLRAAGRVVSAGELDVAVGGPLAATPVGRWFRGLALGRSHGLMVALVTYAHVSGDDLADGRTIAGTGAIGADGSITRIGGLRAKAGAAAQAGADVLLFPAVQASELAGFDSGAMELVGVTSLAEAIAALQR